MGSLRTLWIDDADALRARLPAWRRAATEDQSPFVLPGAFLRWWDAFGAGRQLRACAILDGDEIAALLPLLRDGRVLRSASNDHSGPTTPLARDQVALRALLGALVDSAEPLDLVDVEPAPVLAPLGAAARRTGARVLLTPSAPAPFIDTGSGDLHAWRARHPGWLGRIARYRRQMARRHTLEIVTGGNDVDGVLAAGLRAEASGWKGRAGTAIAQDPTLARFYGGLAHDWARDGALRLSHLALDGQVVAFDLGTERGGRWYSLKTGYDEAYRQLSPGLVLRLAIVERCFADGLAAHDLLGWGAEWKTRMATGERAMQRVRIYPRRPAPIARWAWKAHVRPRLRDVRARAGTAAGRRTPRS
jgi:hypothetical protein